MKDRYNDNTSRLDMTEALFDDTDFSGGTQAGTDPFGDAVYLCNWYWYDYSSKQKVTSNICINNTIEKQL